MSKKTKAKKPFPTASVSADRGVNRNTVTFDLRDVSGHTITDQVVVKFYNQHAPGLNQAFKLDMQGASVAVPGVPASPMGLAQVMISPARYRYKSLFVTVLAGKPTDIRETFFIEPDKAKPIFPAFAEIEKGERWKPLYLLLKKSGIVDSAAWDALGPLKKAGLLNLYAKMQKQKCGTQPLVALVDRIVEFEPARLFAMVRKDLHETASAHGDVFHAVPGALHDLGVGWNMAGSFKTFDLAGNLQLTFAQNASGDWKADIDIDDHQGVMHASDVLKHKITSKDTHPYDIHQILVLFQGLDPGYRLV